MDQYSAQYMDPNDNTHLREEQHHASSLLRYAIEYLFCGEIREKTLRHITLTIAIFVFLLSLATIIIIESHNCKSCSNQDFYFEKEAIINTRIINNGVGYRLMDWKNVHNDLFIGKKTVETSKHRNLTFSLCTVVIPVEFVPVDHINDHMLSIEIPNVKKPWNIVNINKICKRIVMFSKYVFKLYVDPKSYTGQIAVSLKKFNKTVASDIFPYTYLDRKTEPNFKPFSHSIQADLIQITAEIKFDTEESTIFYGKAFYDEEDAKITNIEHELYCLC